MVSKGLNTMIQSVKVVTLQYNITMSYFGQLINMSI